jgi:hypothetical protein
MVNDSKIEAALEALRQLGGYFVWSDEGEDFVLIRKQDFDGITRGPTEVQLELDTIEETEPRSRNESAYIDKINQQLAEQYETDEAALLDFDDIDEEAVDQGIRKKVRFEPIRGDLSPELQE